MKQEEQWSSGAGGAGAWPLQQEVARNFTRNLQEAQNASENIAHYITNDNGNIAYNSALLCEHTILYA